MVNCLQHSYVEHHLLTRKVRCNVMNNSVYRYLLVQSFRDSTFYHTVILCVVYGFKDKKLLSGFAKLREGTILYVVRLRHVRCHCLDFHEILYLSVFSEICRESSDFFKIERVLYMKTQIRF